MYRIESSTSFEREEASKLSAHVHQYARSASCRSHQTRGASGTSLEFANRLSDWNLQASYGSTGDCFDNAAMESTWATVKRDVLSIHGDWKHITRSELRTILFDYIETFYNRQRHQAGLQHHTPAEVYAASAVA